MHCLRAGSMINMACILHSIITGFLLRSFPCFAVNLAYLKLCLWITACGASNPSTSWEKNEHLIMNKRNGTSFNSELLYFFIFFIYIFLVFLNYFFHELLRGLSLHCRWWSFSSGCWCNSSLNLVKLEIHSSVMSQCTVIME